MKRLIGMPEELFSIALTLAIRSKQSVKSARPTVKRDVHQT